MGLVCYTGRVSRPKGFRAVDFWVNHYCDCGLLRGDIGIRRFYEDLYAMHKALEVGKSKRYWGLRQALQKINWDRILDKNFKTHIDYLSKHLPKNKKIKYRYRLLKNYSAVWDYLRYTSNPAIVFKVDEDTNKVSYHIRKEAFRQYLLDDIKTLDKVAGTNLYEKYSQRITKAVLLAESGDYSEFVKLHREITDIWKAHLNMHAGGGLTTAGANAGWLLFMGWQMQNDYKGWIQHLIHDYAEKHKVSYQEASQEVLSKNPDNVLLAILDWNAFTNFWYYQNIETDKILQREIKYDVFPEWLQEAYYFTKTLGLSIVGEALSTRFEGLVLGSAFKWVAENFQEKAIAGAMMRLFTSRFMSSLLARVALSMAISFAGGFIIEGALALAFYKGVEWLWNKLFENKYGIDYQEYLRRLKEKYKLLRRFYQYFRSYPELLDRTLQYIDVDRLEAKFFFDDFESAVSDFYSPSHIEQIVNKLLSGSPVCVLYWWRKGKAKCSNSGWLMDWGSEIPLDCRALRNKTLNEVEYTMLFPDVLDFPSSVKPLVASLFKYLFTPTFIRKEQFENCYITEGKYWLFSTTINGKPYNRIEGNIKLSTGFIPIHEQPVFIPVGVEYCSCFGRLSNSSYIKTEGVNYYVETSYSLASYKPTPLQKLLFKLAQIPNVNIKISAYNSYLTWNPFRTYDECLNYDFSSAPKSTFLEISNSRPVLIPKLSILHLFYYSLCRLPGIPDFEYFASSGGDSPNWLLGSNFFMKFISMSSKLMYIPYKFATYKPPVCDETTHSFYPLPDGFDVDQCFENSKLITLGKSINKKQSLLTPPKRIPQTSYDFPTDRKTPKDSCKPNPVQNRLDAYGVSESQKALLYVKGLITSE